ncbi:MAG: hypothetical protein HY549_08860 [Elusimicrobia bacterium]|nr:hypothetical protein [Elusimicrobiota bacterium]
MALLSLTDSMGRNWASHVCPFLILGGYFLVGFGLMEDREKTGEEARP